ncbi:MAG: EAL domain-containing protein [Pseudomonadota bacterium]
MNGARDSIVAVLGAFALGIAFFVSALPLKADEAREHDLTLGVLAYQGQDDARRRWQPLADYLNRHVPGIKVRVRPLLRHEAESGLDRGELHLLLVNPYDYAWLEATRGVTRVATLRPRHGGDVAPMFGAVAVVRADSRLKTLQDLRGKKLATAAPDAFPLLMIQREIAQLGYDPDHFFGEIEYTGLPLSRAVERVLSGQVDVGIVRTGVLELMTGQHRLAQGSYRILPPPLPVSFNTQVSSRLYPEWPLAIAPTLEPTLARRILAALLDMDPLDPAAVASDIDGWAPPLDYSAVSALMRDLNLGPFAVRPAPDLGSLLRQYWYWLAAVLVPVLVMLMLFVLRSNRRLLRMTRRLDSTLDGLGDAVIRVDALGRINYLNPEAEALGNLPLHAAQGRLFNEIFSFLDVDTLAPLDARLAEAIAGGDVSALPQQVEIKDHARHVFSLRVRHLHSERGSIEGVVLALHDVTAIAQLNEKLRWQAEHDPLTGLFNLRGLEHAFRDLRAVCPLPGGEDFLALLDLDDFKAVNDQGGHAAGDEMLRMVADVLLLWAPPEATVVRMNSDEFIVLLRGKTQHEACDALRRLVEGVAALRLHCGGRVFQVGASVGIVRIDHLLGGLEYHVGEADAACVQAKAQGGDRVHLHHPDDEAIARHHADLAWVTRLRDALHVDAFQLYGQLILPARPGADLHCEVLLRLEDGRGLAMPGEFIPAAERQRLMPRIDWRVVRKALVQFAPVQDVAILTLNLSAQSVQDPLLGDDIVAWFESSGVRPERVCFEITETAALDNLPQAMRLMSRLQGLGCRFALDDFGSGLFSFGMLRGLPVDYLKIDGKLVTEFQHDEVAEVMLGSILDLSRLLKMQSIAEWVEDEATCAVLAELGVNFLQGYGLHRPTPLEQALERAAELVSASG